MFFMQCNKASESNLLPLFFLKLVIIFAFTWVKVLREMFNDKKCQAQDDN